jgi:hypothetical protein
MQEDYHLEWAVIGTVTILTPSKYHARLLHLVRQQLLLLEGQMEMQAICYILEIIIITHQAAAAMATVVWCPHHHLQLFIFIMVVLHYRLLVVTLLPW